VIRLASAQILVMGGMTAVNCHPDSYNLQQVSLKMNKEMEILLKRFSYLPYSLCLEYTLPIKFSNKGPHSKKFHIKYLM